MTSKTPRTGNQYSIHYGDYSAVICELGARFADLIIKARKFSARSASTT